MIVVDLRAFVVKAGCVRSQEQEDSCARPLCPYHDYNDYDYTRG